VKDVTVLVVGGAGYIGTHMVKTLLKAGTHVIVLDDLSRGHRELVTGGTFVEGGIHDTNLLDQLFTDHRIDAVMHFAAHSQVGESVSDPLIYYRNNIAATVELIAAMVRHNVRRFIFSSTAAAYGEPETVPITEDHPLCPTTPYGVTKITVERMLADCDTAHGVKSICLRYFNAAGADESGRIGERHDPETHLIPLVLNVATGQRDNIKIFGTDYPTDDGTCIRDYIHVTDLARAHLLALDVLLDNGDSAVFNLGNSKGYSVREVIELARHITGHPIPVEETARRPGDPAILVAGSEKIRQDLGWHPRYENLEAIIETAWQWHRREAERCLS
jgi:UDP-glucose 4-epimerase